MSAEDASGLSKSARKRANQKANAAARAAAGGAAAWVVSLGQASNVPMPDAAQDRNVAQCGVRVAIVDDRRRPIERANTYYCDADLSKASRAAWTFPEGALCFRTDKDRVSEQYALFELTVKLAAPDATYSRTNQLLIGGLMASNSLLC